MSDMATYTEYNQASSVESYRNTPQQNISSGRPNSSESHVSFNHKNKEEEKDKRQKYLTAKYGQHQMMLIRKRLAVEDWLYDQLRELHDCQVCIYPLLMLLEEVMNVKLNIVSSVVSCCKVVGLHQIPLIKKRKIYLNKWNDFSCNSGHYFDAQ